MIIFTPPQLLHPTTLYIQLCPLFFFFIKSSLYYQYNLGCVAFHRSTVCLPGATLSKETDSPFTTSYQFLVASRLGVGLHVNLPFPCWDLASLELVRGLCMLSESLNSYAALLCPQDTVSLYSSTTSGSSAMIPEPWEEGIQTLPDILWVLCWVLGSHWSLEKRNRDTLG